jgi:hypothetical protein
MGKAMYEVYPTNMYEMPLLLPNQEGPDTFP